jgi:hypothetical protein
MKAAADMTPSEINRRLDALEKKRARLNDEMIAAGRGHETFSETMNLGDPLALRYQHVAYEMQEYRDEIRRRYGPGAPSRCPKGLGPIRGR